MPDFYELLTSGCDRVWLINCEVEHRVMCGFVFIDAFTDTDTVTLFDSDNAIATIVLTADLRGRSQAIYISSPQDNLEFQLKQ